MSSAEARGPDRVALVVAALTVGGATLRLPGLASRPLWMDEALELSVATRADAWGAIAADDLHPPLLAGLLRAMASVSHAEAWLRAPSFLASVAMIPLAWWAGRAWGGTRAGLATASLVTVCPPLVVYAGEARPYALGAMLLLTAVGAVPGGHTVLLTVACALASWTLYGAWPVALIVAGLYAFTFQGRARAVPLLGSLVAMSGLAVTLLPAQRAAQGAALTAGKFAPWFWTGSTLPSWALHALPGLPGWIWTGRADVVGQGAGVLALLGLVWIARRPGPRALTWIAWAPPLGFVALAGLGLHPFGPTRHLLVLVPALAVWVGVRLGDLSATAALPWLLVAMGSGALAPRPPTQDLPALIPAISDAPVLADASASWGLRWYLAEDVPSLPWRTGPAFDAALSVQAPRGRFWFVHTSTRPAAEIDLQRWASGSGRSLGQVLRVPGAGATEVLAVP